jgi:hypothetical protein
MAVLETIGWALLAATAAWILAIGASLGALSRYRAAMQQEVRHWKAEANREAALTAQLKQEIEMWSKGCQQGRDDVISIVPLLVAAVHERLAGARTADLTEADYR